MYSYISDIVFLIVLPFSSGEQSLYGNSVSPYCFPLPAVLMFFIYLFIYLLLVVTIFFNRTVVKSVIKLKLINFYYN